MRTVKVETADIPVCVICIANGRYVCAFDVEPDIAGCHKVNLNIAAFDVITNGRWIIPLPFAGFDDQH